METKELMMNVVALGILVVTVIVNVCIQLGTGVIYVFWIEHAVIMFLMVVLFAILISSSLAIPVTKSYLDLKYNKKFKVAEKECSNSCNTSITRKLRNDLMRYWMMAHTCNPQFVTGRLATCIASGAFCLLGAMVLAEAILRSYLMPWCFTFCNGESDYRWSTTLILVTQSVAVGGGTIGPALRWFIAIKFMCPKKTNKSYKIGFSSVEKYWVQILRQLKDCPLNLRISGRHGRKLVHNAKNKALDLCILIQKAMNGGKEATQISYTTFGETESFEGFEGVQKFDSEQVPSLDFEEPPNSWALPVVTLTSIAIAISNTDFHPVKELIKCVNEGLKYIRVIENNLDIKRDLTNIRKAAEVVWAGVDLHYRWLDVELLEMAVQGRSLKDIISELSDIAKNKFMELRKNDVSFCLSSSPSKWPLKVLAANSMYRICQTLLLTTDNRSIDCSKVMFERLTAMISDVIGACLTNLQLAITMECHQSTIEQREECVRHAFHLLGEAEKILEILSCQQLMSSNPQKFACINEWRAVTREKDQQHFKSSPTSSDSDFSISSDLYLNID
ncbi:UNVERIFIED_CONTAM: hypothetical protein Sradi_4943700 [Sesamum radiatum]|uniref:Uncharacterized protein n=1 Tax=Sesamum radiatum TaxID=300843 RepID=A0AAW2MDX9_SESRA